MKIYVIRHGKTKMNKENVFNGQVDEDITEEGIEQAKKASESLKEVDFDIVYCSPLIRAKHTCELVNVNKISVIYDDRLMERTFGEADGNELSEYGITYDDFVNYFFQTDIPGYEDSETFFKRVHSFLDDLKLKDYKNVLIVTHGCVLRAIYYYFNEIPEDGNLLQKYPRPINCQIDTYEL